MSVNVSVVDLHIDGHEDDLSCLECPRASNKKWLMRTQLTMSQFEGCDFLGNKTVNEDVESNDTPQYGGVCRGKRNRTPRRYTSPYYAVRPTKKEVRGGRFLCSATGSKLGEETLKSVCQDRILHQARGDKLAREWCSLIK